jgi:hypothetical protein
MLRIDLRPWARLHLGQAAYACEDVGRCVEYCRAHRASIRHTDGGLGQKSTLRSERTADRAMRNRCMNMVDLPYLRQMCTDLG